MARVPEGVNFFALTTSCLCYMKLLQPDNKLYLQYAASATWLNKLSCSIQLLQPDYKLSMQLMQPDCMLCLLHAATATWLQICLLHVAPATCLQFVHAAPATWPQVVHAACSSCNLTTSCPCCRWHWGFRPWSTWWRPASSLPRENQTWNHSLYSINLLPTLALVTCYKRKCNNVFQCFCAALLLGHSFVLLIWFEA